MSQSHLERPVEQSLRHTLVGVGKAAYTVFMVPEHDSSIYIEVAHALRDEVQPTQAPLDAEVRLVEELAIDTRIQPRLGSKKQAGLFGVLMQFLSYLPELRPYATTPFEHTEKLYQAIIRHQRKPLGFPQQLNIALDQTKGDLPEALWRLFITARLYARWFDTSVIVDMPSFTRDEVIERMMQWSRAVAACKPHGSCRDQDASGDTYYCWTHALAKVLYTALPARRSPLTRLEALALQHGTHLNHGLAHKFKPQRLPSNHTVAAAYGNAIGDALVHTFLTSEEPTS